MQRYIITRLLLAIVIAFGVTVVAFASIQLIPADVVDIMLGTRRDPEVAAALRHKLGLDQPPIQQYFRWLARLAQGNLGSSLNTGQPVMGILRQRMPVTLELAFLATSVATLIGIPAGITAAVRQYSTVDKVSTAAAIFGLSVPDFWLATLLILAFSVTWRLFPPGGLLPSLWEDPVGNLKRMAMPALSMGLPSAAVYFRLMRSSMLEVIRSDYMLTAYSKGLTERRVVLVHAVKNAIIPVVTATGLEMTWMLGGAFIVETIFSLPGLGRSTVQAIYERDYTVLQGSLLVFALVVVGISVLTDLAYAALDPRIRYE
jgi:peptide/nickel transport system permease protein